MLKKSKKISKSPTSRTESRKKPVHKIKKDSKKNLKLKSKFKKTIYLKLFLLFFIVGIIFCGYIFLTLPDINNEKAIFRKAKITIIAENGYKIATFGDKFNRPATYNEIPKHLIDNLILIEDKRFHSHFGIDIFAIARAVITNIQTGKKSRGASTLTQQLAKNLFLNSEKSYMRKIRELFLAFYLEYKLTKEQIITLYLNRSYFGSGNYGISAAADYYYGKKVSDIDLYQSVSLIAMLKSPLGYNPIINPKKSKDRTFYLLKKLGYKNVKYSPALTKNNQFAGYFNDWILQQAINILGEINTDILIKTTLDYNMQKIVEHRASLVKNDLETAIILNDYNGAIKAMSGGKSYKTSQFNRATQAQRQQGSLLKPFLYLLAMENGHSLNEKIYDEPINIDGWNVKNYSKKYYGNISLYDALVRSLNTVPAYLANYIGIIKFQKYLSRFGINGSCSDTAVIVLGVCNNTLLDTVGAYTTLASGGYAIYPFGITEITDDKNNILYKRQVRDKNVIINNNHLQELEHALSDVVTIGTGKKAYIDGMNIKGKTGTTQNYRDALFIGYDRGIVIGVWVGKDDNSSTNNITGGGLPATIFKDVMKEIYR